MIVRDVPGKWVLKERRKEDRVGEVSVVLVGTVLSSDGESTGVFSPFEHVCVESSFECTCVGCALCRWCMSDVMDGERSTGLISAAWSERP